METKTATVKRINHNVNSYSSNYGTMYVHEIEFSNGDKGNYSSKSETCTKFKEGEEASYTIETKKVGNFTNINIKPVLQEANSFQKKSTGSEESFSLSYAKDLACANIAAGKQITSKQVIEIAEEFFNWLKSKK